MSRLTPCAGCVEFCRVLSSSVEFCRAVDMAVELSSNVELLRSCLAVEPGYYRANGNKSATDGAVAGTRGLGV